MIWEYAKFAFPIIYCMKLFNNATADENVPLNEVSFTDEEVSLTSTKIDVD